MSQRPKRDAVTNRDDTETLLHLQKRRTTAEVLRDKELAASAKAAAKAQKEATSAQKKKCVAAFEDQLREEDQQQEKKMSRPDLVTARCGKPSTKGQEIPVKAQKSKTVKNTSKPNGTNVQAEVSSLAIEQGEPRTEASDIALKSRALKSKMNTSKKTKTNTQVQDFASSSIEQGSPEEILDDENRRLSFEVESGRPVLDSVLENFDEAQPEGFDYLSDGPINLPEDSVVDTESDGYFNAPEPEEEESDGDHEKDEDYVMGVASEDEDSDDSQIIDVSIQSMKGKGKMIKNIPKTDKFEFRRDVNNSRTNVAIAGNTAINSIAKMKPPTAQKRKEPLSENRPLDTVIEKRAKKEEGGLLSGWSKKLAKQRLEVISARNNSRKAVEDQDDTTLDYAGGEFDEDEPVESVRAARDVKKSAISVRGKITSVKIVEPVPVALDPSSSVSGRRVKKEKYTLASLPFPRGAESISYSREWRKSFKPTLIHWAATLKDPFGTNAVMGDILTEVWMAVFPSIANEVVVGSPSRQAIIHLAGDVLTDWRSSMGKEGLRLVLLSFNNEGITKEDAPKAAEYYLENYRFIYQNPDNDTGNKGAFMSPLVSACLGVHLKKTVNNVIQYGYPVGALAIATAVLERGLHLVKSGQIGLDSNDLDDDTTTSKKRKVNRYGGYTDIEWGEKTRGWVGGIERLDENKWKIILRAAVEKMDLTGADEGDAVDGANGGTIDP